MSASTSSSPLVWLITGTSSGFGTHLVSSVLARGDRVIATARSLDSIKHLESNPNVCTRQLDVTSGVPALSEIISEAVKVWGRIDVVVNNAGVGYHGIMEEGGSSLLQKNFAVNFFGVMDVCAACLPHLRAQKSGTIVVVSSRSAWKCEIPVSFVLLDSRSAHDLTSSLTELLHTGSYASSKAAVSALTQTLAVELAPFGVRVLLIEPGGFRTDILRQEYHTSNPIADYDEMRGASKKLFAGVYGMEKGDPAKAMEALVDVVRGEGPAEGRPWPGHLVLGEDADTDVRKKCQKVVENLDGWAHIARGVSFD
ncbi:hypothetical protein R3P38DRAFT_3594786 [Favolaschia claudopus]|uniref:NAD(P)-binding protein n=1 Tax=Favolaschia claudopus TaxID=2862362 RepID=A0AAW0DM15_9AGAR